MSNKTFEEHAAEYDELSKQRERMNQTPHEHQLGFVLSHTTGEWFDHCVLCDHKVPITEDEWNRRRSEMHRL